MADDESKIIVDEDWKSQVQRERDQARQAAEQQEAADESGAAEGLDAMAGEDRGLDPGMDAAGAQGHPEPSFEVLMSWMATQVMVALGLLVPRDTQEVYVNLEEGKFWIEMLDVLREKTAGNLSKDEESQLTATIAEFQQAFVTRAQQVQEAQLRSAGIDPGNLKGE